MYGAKGSVFSVLPSSIGTDGRTFDWTAGDQTLRGLRAAIRPPSRWTGQASDGASLATVGFVNGAAYEIAARATSVGPIVDELARIVLHPGYELGPAGRYFGLH